MIPVDTFRGHKLRMQYWCRDIRIRKKTCCPRSGWTSGTPSAPGTHRWPKRRGTRTSWVSWNGLDQVGPVCQREARPKRVRNLAVGHGNCPIVFLTVYFTIKWSNYCISGYRKIFFQLMGQIFFTPPTFDRGQGPHGLPGGRGAGLLQVQWRRHRRTSPHIVRGKLAGLQARQEDLPGPIPDLPEVLHCAEHHRQHRLGCGLQD